jgi:hypothetical protein
LSDRQKGKWEMSVNLIRKAASADLKLKKGELTAKIKNCLRCVSDKLATVSVDDIERIDIDGAHLFMSDAKKLNDELVKIISDITSLEQDSRSSAFTFKGLLTERSATREEMITKVKSNIRSCKALLALSDLTPVNEIRIDAAIATLSEARACQERYNEASEQIADIERELS